MRLLGLYREAEYSPGRHQANDSLLLEQVAASLRDHGFSVDLATIDAAERDSPALVFSMCQGRNALARLTSWQADGLCIVNSPQASLNTYRERLSSLMERAGIPFPPTRFVSTREADNPAVDVNGGLWLKRGDVHAAVVADVQWIDSTARLRGALKEFASRGIEHAALQRHVPGDEIKFYGVIGERFFHWLYAAESVLESGQAPPASPKQEATAARRTPIDVDTLRRLAEEAAAVAGLDVFGGDAIVGPSGELTLIDLNDWPSFAPCLERASQAIAGYLMRRVDAPWNSGLVPSANESAV